MKRFVQLVVIMCACASASVVAQEKPYAPKAANTQSLIQPAAFSRIPITFNYPEVSQRQVAIGPRFDFEIVLDVPFEDFVGDFEGAFKSGEVVMTLEEGIYANARDPKLLVIGRSNSPDGGNRYTLGNRYLPFRLTFSVRPDGARSVVTLQNSVWSILHSGIMPARVGYKPAEGGELRFRGN